MQHTLSYYETTYAKLILFKGINLREDQNIVIKTSPKTYHFAQIIAKEAYKAGAGFVHIDLQDYELDRVRIDHQDNAHLQSIPEFQTAMQFQYLAEDWAYIRIDNTEDRLSLVGVDTDKLTTFQSAIRKASTTFRKSLMRHEHAWCVVCVPGPVWAKQILGPDATVADLYEILIPILRLEEPDPIAAWDDHANRLLALSATLTDKQLETIHITDEETGTDLTLKLSKDAKWIGGPKALPNGRLYFPNIPTEEVFTVPHMLTANGIVYTTKPVTIFGSRVDGCSFTFKEGKVVDFSAAKGEDILQRFLETDEGASFIGELALVDKDTPIAQSDHIFNSILYDENAACHFALGAGYPSCLKHGKDLSSDSELKQAGCNTSVLHTDFMFGSPTTSITATTYSGEELVIMHQGSINPLLVQNHA